MMVHIFKPFATGNNFLCNLRFEHAKRTCSTERKHFFRISKKTFIDTTCMHYIMLVTGSNLELHYNNNNKYLHSSFL